VEPLGDCPSPLAAVVPPKKPFPILLKPGKKLAVSFTVDIGCAVDPAKNTATSPGHEDYRYAVTVDTSALVGRPDTDPGDDTCPREGGGSAAGFQGKLDPGCGSKLPTGTPGGPVATDVVVK
jgi:hypothetical protein